MSLSTALSIGRSGLVAQQAAMTVTGNNIANAGNANYTRQVAKLSPSDPQQLRAGLFVGSGVDLVSISRQIDDALEGRLRSAISDAEGSDQMSVWLTQVEAAFNELSEQDVSSQMSSFFNSWSDLAGKATDSGQRLMVVQNGQTLVDSVKALRSRLAGLATDATNKIRALVSQADLLSEQVAKLNQQIVSAEGSGGGEASSLRDQRDAALKELSGLMEITSSADANGMVSVYAGEQLLVAGTRSYGITTEQQTVNGKVSTGVVTDSGSLLNISAGQLGGLLQVQRETIQPTIDKLDAMAGGLIFELNRIYSQGRGTEGFTSVSAQESVLNANGALASDGNLAFRPTNGSFSITVNTPTGPQTHLLSVKVGVPGQADTTLNDIASAINDAATGVTGVTASVTAGRLSLAINNAAPAGSTISFGNDSSGVLAALGINTFFTGHDALTIGMNQTVVANTAYLSAGTNGGADGSVALKIAAMEKVPLGTMSGQTLESAYQSMVNTIATQGADTLTRSEAAAAVRDTLLDQREALSGVSSDEEAINLMRQQQAYQGAARFISAVNEMMQVLLNMAG